MNILFPAAVVSYQLPWHYSRVAEVRSIAGSAVSEFVKSALFENSLNGYGSRSSAITAAAWIAAAGFAKAARHVRNMSYSEGVAETSVVSALHLKKLPKFFVTLTTRLADWNGIQSPDSVTNIHRRIANEFWSDLKISLGTEATYEDDHVVDDGR